MTAEASTFEILVVDDDDVVLDQLRQLLPTRIGDNAIAWEFNGNFDDALALLRRRRFDVLVSDIYLGRDQSRKTIAQGDARARELVDEIRNRRFCPIVLFTDGQLPADLVERPFVWSGDKGSVHFHEHLTKLISEAFLTGLPEIARRLHDELDRYAGSYVWQFLSEKWDDLRKKHDLQTEMLERIIRRRTAIHLARIDTEAEEVETRQTVDPVDYYIYPPVGRHMRLGEIIRRKATGEFRVVLTPHCLLTLQPGQGEPRATHILTALAIPAADLSGAWTWDSRKPSAIADNLRRRTSFPAFRVGGPDGRYCFLPAFLDLPDLYCDLMQIESFGLQVINDDFERIAVLDWPFAEALQACLAKLYGAVGVPSLNQNSVGHLKPPSP